jgi:processive 1,2-diacylglycerol beta-glucosyltransferase
MTRVLILTASYGSGHLSAATSLAAAFRGRGASVTIADHFRQLVHPTFASASQALYGWILRRAPGLWGLAYGLGDRLASDSPLTFGMTRLGTVALGRLLRQLAPDVVVTVHATPSAAMASLVQAGERVPPHTTVVTDFVAHSQWMARHVDRYCVAADEVRHEFVARGIPRERIAVTGVPVRRSFERPADRLEARQRFGLDPDRPVVLAMAGSDGSLGRLPAVSRVLLASRRPLQGMVITGRDRALHTELCRLTDGSRVRVLGYVRHIRALMAAADLLVTKAGGMTLAEAMAAELPLLTFGSLPGQERQNERFASRTGIALSARSTRELELLIDRALTAPELLEQLRGRMRRVRRPDASQRIVDLVLERVSVA